MHEDRRVNREREMPWTALDGPAAGGASGAQRWRVRGGGVCAPCRPARRTQGPGARFAARAGPGRCQRGEGSPVHRAKGGGGGHGALGPCRTRVPAGGPRVMWPLVAHTAPAHTVHLESFVCLASRLGAARRRFSGSDSLPPAASLLPRRCGDRGPLGRTGVASPLCRAGWATSRVTPRRHSMITRARPA
jgi:hypothetical protein